MVVISPSYQPCTGAASSFNTYMPQPGEALPRVVFFKPLLYSLVYFCRRKRGKAGVSAPSIELPLCHHL